MTTGELIDLAIPFFGGLTVTLWAFGVGSGTPEIVRWRERHGASMRVLGPIVMLLAVARWLGTLCVGNNKKLIQSATKK